MSERLVEIHPGSMEWDAWLRHWRGTKNAARMLACLGGKTKSGDIIPARAWLAPTKLPPEAPRAEGPRPAGPIKIPEATVMVDRPSIPDGKVDEIADRLLARAARDDREASEKARRAKSRHRADALLEAALAAAASNGRPHVDERDDLDVIAVVDPSEEMEMERIGRGSPMLRRRRNAPKQLRVISLREDPVGRMAKRGQLGDSDEERDIRLRAARYYENLYARAEIGGARGIDPMKDIVDGGCFVTPDTDVRLQAQARLASIDARLYSADVELVRAILVTKWDLATYAAARGEHGDTGGRGWRYFGRRFRDVLDEIAKMVGIKPKPNGHRLPRDRFAQIAPPPELPTGLYTAIHRAKVTPR